MMQDVVVGNCLMYVSLSFLFFLSFSMYRFMFHDNKQHMDKKQIIFLPRIRETDIVSILSALLEILFRTSK